MKKWKLLPALLIGYFIGYAIHDPPKKKVSLDEITYEMRVKHSNVINVNGVNGNNFEKYYREEVSYNMSQDLRKQYIDHFLELNEGIIHVQTKNIFGNKVWQKYDGKQKIDYNDFNFRFLFGTGSWIDYSHGNDLGKKKKWDLKTV